MSTYHIVCARATTITCVPTTASFHKGVRNGRNKIKGFTPSAGTRMRCYLRSCVAEYSFMFTLTYPSQYPCDGVTCKRHLKRLFQRIERHFYCERLGAYKERSWADEVEGETRWSLFWFLEFQQRGAPHFHIFSTHRLPKDWLAKAWYEICGTDDVRHLHAGTRCETLRAGRAGTISYASKYAAKQEQKAVPESFMNVGRYWGVSGLRKTLSANITVGVTPDNAQQVTESLEIAKKQLDLLAEAGHVRAVRTTRPGSWSYYAVSDIGLKRIPRIMKDILQDIMFIKLRSGPNSYDLYDILFDYSL